jgi:hypothetical protein
MTIPVTSARESSRRSAEGAAGGSDAQGPVRPGVVGAVTWLVLVVVLGLHSWDFVTSAYIEGGDDAVNSILIDEAKDLDLLVGNYSRVGFNHPGPAFLYVQAAGEVLFHDVIPLTASPFGAHRLSAMLLDAAFVALAATIIAAQTRRVVPAAVLVVVVLAYASSTAGLMTGTWMPFLYVWPYLLMLVAAASVLAGTTRDLWSFVLAASFLVHGHVSFLLFVGATTLVVGISLALRWRAEGRWPVPRRATVASAGILGLFLVPIGLNLALNWPGELEGYLTYSGSDSAGGHPLVEVVSYVKDYWVDGPIAGVLVVIAVGVLVGVVLAWRAMPSRTMTVALLAMVGLSTLCTFVYVARGADNLELDYIAQFYVTAPMITILCAAIVVDESILARARPALATALVVLAVVALWAGTRDDLVEPVSRGEWVPGALAAVESEVGSDIALSFEVSTWPPAAALVEAWRRAGVDVCVVDVNPLWAVLFTDDLICTPEELEERTVVASVPSDQPSSGNDIIVVPGELTLRFASA